MLTPEPCASVSEGALASALGLEANAQDGVFREGAEAVVGEV